MHILECFSILITSDTQDSSDAASVAICPRKCISLIIPSIKTFRLTKTLDVREWCLRFL